MPVSALQSPLERRGKVEASRADPVQPAKFKIRDSALQLSLATRQLSTMMASGLTIVRCLQVLGNQPENIEVSQVFNYLTGLIEQGNRLSHACAQCPRVFSPVYVGLIQVGEASGQLTTCLNQLTVVLERDYQVRRQLRSALTYPAFVVGVATLLVMLIFYVIMPNFVTIFRDLDMPMPVLTRILMWLTDALRSPGFWLFLAGAILLTYQWVTRTWASPTGRVFLYSRLLALPLFGKIFQVGTLSRYCVVMHAMLDQGVDLLLSVHLAAQASGNPVLMADSSRFKDSLTNGVSLSSYMAARSELYPPVLRQMVLAGEEASSVADNFQKVGFFLNEELNHRMGLFNSLIEPVLMFGVGTTIGTIALAIMLPLYAYLGKLGS